MIRSKKVLHSFLTLLTLAGLAYVLIVAFRPEPHSSDDDHADGHDDDQHHHHHHHSGSDADFERRRGSGRNFDNFVRLAAQPGQPNQPDQPAQPTQPAKPAQPVLPAHNESQSQRQNNDQRADGGRAEAEKKKEKPGRPLSPATKDESDGVQQGKPMEKEVKDKEVKDKEASRPRHQGVLPPDLTPASNSTSRPPAPKVDRNLVLSDSERARLRRKQRQKYLIFLCDDRRSCGGWGDRQRGLVGVFLLALVTGRRFGLNMSVPCPVGHFYRPNQYDWLVTDSQLRNKTSIVLDDVNSALKMTGRLLKMDFEAEYPQDVVYIRTNGEYWLGVRVNPRYSGLMPVWARGARHQYFAQGWRTLMAPRAGLQERLDGFLQGMDFAHRTQPLVCAHVRVGRSASGIRTDTEVRANVSHLPVLWDFLQPWVRNGSFLFVASDTLEVRTLARQRFGERMIDSGGDIIHIDQGKQLPNACRGFESALLDQHILSLCDVLVTSHSIFSQRAAYIRGTDEHLYSFLKGKVNKSTMNG